MAGKALRVLAVASKPNASLETAERDMTFLGLVGMIDPPRPEAEAAVRTCAQASIKVVMITGDHPLTAQAVGRELGILQFGRVLTGAELEAMSNDALERDVEEIVGLCPGLPSAQAAHRFRIAKERPHRRHDGRRGQ